MNPYPKTTNGKPKESKAMKQFKFAQYLFIGIGLCSISILTIVMMIWFAKPEASIGDRLFMGAYGTPFSIIGIHFFIKAKQVLSND